MIRKVSFVLFITLLVSLWRTYQRYTTLQMVFCDVGQGDATLLQYGSFQLVVDGGVDNAAQACLGRHMPFFDRTIELVVATHPDADHIGGLPSILDAFFVSEVLWNGETKQTADFLAFHRSLQSKQVLGTNVRVPQHLDRYRVGDELLVTVWFPRVATPTVSAQIDPKCETLLQDILSGSNSLLESSNNGSIVLFITFDHTSIALMGDLEAEGEKTLDCLGLLKQTTIIKVGHHGSKSSSTAEFVNTTRPEISVFSVGENNHFGHPSPEVMNRYEAVGSSLLRTDQGGDIELLSNGGLVWQPLLVNHWLRE